MPNVVVPDGFKGRPKRFELPAGTSLARVHNLCFGPAGFNPNLAAAGRGGRFDGTTDDPYSFLYAGEDELVAISETLLRDVPLDRLGRYLPVKVLEGRALSWLRSTRAVRLARLLSAQDLAAVGQDTWLTMARSADYAATRRWAHAIRRWAPWAEGFVWRSRREPEGKAFVFFADRVRPGTLVEDASRSANWGRIDQGPGEIRVRRVLAGYRVTLR